MDISHLVTIDFETERIEPRPKYPPEPVGVSLKFGGNPSAYYAWGHPTENNCTREAGAAVLRRLFEDTQIHILFHNAPFDVAVAVERMGMPMPSWNRIHDTMFLLYLNDPHARSLSLKPSSEALLGWAPEEQDAVHAWIWNHRHALTGEYGGKITRAKSGENSPGAWIAKAPGALVARYAEGDTDRTFALFAHLFPKIRRSGMEEAYDRERKIMPILMENERVGLRVDLSGLQEDIPIYREALESVEHLMRVHLCASGLSFDNDRDLAATLVERGAVHEDRWVETVSGQLSVSKENLPPDAFKDPLLASALGYRNRLVTCLKMFMEPWAEQAAVNNSHIHTSWNQVRGDFGGTRTGRPSMRKPNLLNVSKSFEDRSDGYVHPEQLGLPRLPQVRSYVLPDEGHIFLHRDFSGQEVRIFAHFESGELAAAYRENPHLDPHEWIRGAIKEALGHDLERTRVKNVTFARLYGGGANSVYQQARCASLAEAKEIMAFHDRAVPGRKILSEEIQRIVRRGDPIRTWGGRLYHVEPPKMVDGRKRNFEYKMINYLVQGSAADATKEALCRWYYEGGPDNGARFLLTVYDEINISAPSHVQGMEMEFLRNAMESIELDVPLLSAGKQGYRWGAWG